MSHVSQPSRQEVRSSSLTVELAKRLLVELTTFPIRMTLRTVLSLKADHLQGLTA